MIYEITYRIMVAIENLADVIIEAMTRPTYAFISAIDKIKNRRKRRVDKIVEKVDINVNLENLTEEERESLLSLIEKAKKPKSKVWEPQKGEVYLFLYSEGDIGGEVFEGSELVSDRFSIGNLFRTKEEAEEAKQALKYRAMLKRLSIESGEDANPWDGEKRHHFILYNALTDNFYFDSATQTREEKFYFTSKKDAENALATIGEENFKRYILGIKE